MSQEPRPYPISQLLTPVVAVWYEQLDARAGGRKVEEQEDGGWLAGAERIPTAAPEGDAIWVKIDTGEVPWREVDYGGRKGGGDGMGGEGRYTPGLLRVTVDAVEERPPQKDVDVESVCELDGWDEVWSLGPVDSNSVPVRMRQSVLRKKTQQQKKRRSSMFGALDPMAWFRSNKENGSSKAITDSTGSKLLAPTRFLGNLFSKTDSGKRNSAVKQNGGIYMAKEPWNLPGNVVGTDILWDDRVGPRNERWVYVSDPSTGSSVGNPRPVEFTQVL
jgi:hypothetical protein